MLGPPVKFMGTLLKYSSAPFFFFLTRGLVLVVLTLLVHHRGKLNFVVH